MSTELDHEELPLGQLKDLPDTPHKIVYADQVLAIAYGPFVSRVTFGEENHLAQTRTPTITIVMPTNMLHALAKNLTRELDSPSARESISKGHQDYMMSSKPREE